MMWNVTVETRKSGSRRVFINEVFRVSAHNAEQAREWAIEDAHLAGLETRFVKEVKQEDTSI